MLESVRVRMTLWYTAVFAVVFLLLAILTYLIYQRSIRQRTDSNLVELADAVVTTFNAELADQTGGHPVRDSAREAMTEHRFRGTIYVLLDSNGSVIADSLDLPPFFPSSEYFAPEFLSSPELRSFASGAPSGHKFLATLHSGKNGFRAYARSIPAVGQQYLLVLLQSLHPQQEILEDIRATFLWIIPFALLLVSVGGYILARKSLAPVAAMASKARTIGAANLHDRLAVANPRDELGQLSVSFNELLDRLDKSFEQQKKFVADASHELRTPVAILRGETEVALSREDRLSEEYRESLVIVGDEARRLTRIIEDLFTLTRADAGQYPLKLAPLYFDELVTDVCRHARSLAATKNISLKSAIAPDLPIQADESLLRRMLLNLIDNAIKYTPVGGSVSLRLNKDGSLYVLHISDTGPGIPEDSQTRIFERFFRADKARSRSEGELAGAGLGLSIAQWIAEAHHGKITLSRSDSSGSAFTVTLPTSESV